MNNKRSYLDTLNAGRQRRSNTTVDELGRTLDAIGSRLERSLGEQSSRQPPRRDDYARTERASQYHHQDDLYARDLRDTRETRSNDPYRRQSIGDLARSIESTRRQEEGVASMSTIAAELKAMRDELRSQMSTGLQREFKSLRTDIEKVYSAATSGAHGMELTGELERLSDAIASLATRSDDRSVGLLQNELDDVKAAISHLAREESLGHIERQWRDFDDRFDSRLADGLSRRGSDPAIAALTERLEQIASAVDNIPQSLSLRTLEDKVRTLASAIDQFATSNVNASAPAFNAIEDRLDEISRAIVASSMNASSQPSDFQIDQFERIEARISSLARQIEDLSNDRPTGELMDRIGLLAQRVDELSHRSHVPAQSMERLARQIEDMSNDRPSGELMDRISLLAQRVDELSHRSNAPSQSMERLAQQISEIAGRLDSGLTVGDSEMVMRGLESRIDTLADTLQRQQGDADRRGQTIFRELEQRLADLSVRLDEAPRGSQDGPILDAIDARFVELTHRFDKSASNASDGAAIRGLEDRLEDISARLEHSSRQAVGIDASLFRNLEDQVAALSDHLVRPNINIPEFEDIAPRLAQIERSIEDNRDAILESAKIVAEQTILHMGAARQDSPAVAGLANDLKALDNLARRSDERNSRTFEAIHDTLLKIVDRLGTLEGGAVEKAVERKVANPPSLDLDFQPRGPEMDEPTVQQQAPVRRSPAEAAAAAAHAAIDDEADAPEQVETGRRSMLGGLARAFSGRREAAAEIPLAGDAEPTLGMSAPMIDVDDPIDPKSANRPLDPGATPNLNSIMKRVRDERGQPIRPGDADTAKSDFIAAARRAAQAAASEAETRKRPDSDQDGGSSGLVGTVKRHRKSLLMAAGGVVIMIAALQLGKAFMADGGEAEPVSIAVEPQQPQPAELSAPASEQDGANETSEPISAQARAATQSEPVQAETENEGVTAALPEELQGEPTEPADASSEPVEASAEPAAQDAAEPVSVAKAYDVPADAGPVTLRDAAEAGDAKALFEIGSRYAEGRGGKQDMKQAAAWYERSAEAGFAPAQYRIGNFYEKAIGVERDIPKAKTWYQLAAQQGNASAMHNLAVLYAMGADGTTDNESAGRWFIKAAELGVKDSQFNLGILSAKGIGVPQSLEESYKWFALVAKTGDKDATMKRDEVANALRPEQLTRARASAELWKPKELNVEANDVSVPDEWRESAAKTASVDMKQAVRNIQLILNKNGYDAGGADGVMGAKTKTAIASFQRANGLEPTGEVDEKLIGVLLKKK